MLKVLIAEDDLMIADLAEEILIDGGYDVCGIARTVAEAVALAHRHKPDLVVLDLRLADGGLGTEIAAQLLPLGRGQQQPLRCCTRRQRHPHDRARNAAARDLALRMTFQHCHVLTDAGGCYRPIEGSSPNR